jgi:hypothetical protein
MARSDTSVSHLFKQCTFVSLEHKDAFAFLAYRFAARTTAALSGVMWSSRVPVNTVHTYTLPLFPWCVILEGIFILLVIDSGRLIRQASKQQQDPSVGPKRTEFHYPFDFSWKTSSSQYLPGLVERSNNLRMESGREVSPESKVPERTVFCVQDSV